MKKLLTSLLALSLVLAGCSKVEKKKESEAIDQDVVDEAFKENSKLEKYIEDYDLDKVVYVDDDNKKNIFDEIESYVKNHPTEVIILASAGIIVISGIGYVFTNVAIAAAAMAIIYDVVGEDKVQETIQVIENNEKVKNVKEYFKTHNTEEVLNDGVNFMKDQLNQISEHFNVDMILGK